ncbi:MAG: hypothetical protein SF182_24495 [Deltaproteobacteria bacterium]|nr:hypothetical protein [Deltaproteobacteria bacterium]
MKHVTRYLALATASAAIGLTMQPVGATEPAAARPALRADAPPARVAPPLRTDRAVANNLNPARGPVVSDPHALPSEAVDWTSDAPHHTWSGYSAN